jgi:uncharacterized protein
VTCTNCGATLDASATRCPACDTATGTDTTPTGTDAPTGTVAPTGNEPTTGSGTPAGGNIPAGGSTPAGDSTPAGGDAGHGTPPSGPSFHPEPVWTTAGGYDPGSTPPPSGTAGGPGAPPAWGTSLTHPSGLPSDVRGWGIGAHLAGLGIGLATAALFGFAGPLAVWLIKRDEHPFIDHHAKEALNFQLTVLVAILGAGVLAIPVVILGVLTLGIGLLLIGVIVLAAVVAWFVFPIVGAVKASNGEGYRYPLTIRFVS